MSIVLGLFLNLSFAPDNNSKATLVVCLTTIGIFSLVSEFTGMYRNWTGSQLRREIGCAFLTWATTLVGLLAVGSFSEYTTELSTAAVLTWFAFTPLLAAKPG